MVPLQKLRGVVVPVEYQHVYKHYLEKEVDQVEFEYQQLVKTLEGWCTDKKSKQVNQQIISKVSLEDFTHKVYNYFLKIIYVIIKTSDNFKQTVSITTCIKDACTFASAEYLSLSILRSIA